MRAIGCRNWHTGPPCPSASTTSRPATRALTTRSPARSRQHRHLRAQPRQASLPRRAQHGQPPAHAPVKINGRPGTRGRSTCAPRPRCRPCCAPAPPSARSPPASRSATSRPALFCKRAPRRVRAGPAMAIPYERLRSLVLPSAATPDMNPPTGSNMTIPRKAQRCTWAGQAVR